MALSTNSAARLLNIDGDRVRRPAIHRNRHIAGAAAAQVETQRDVHLIEAGVLY